MVTNRTGKWAWLYVWFVQYHHLSTKHLMVEVLIILHTTKTYARSHLTEHTWRTTIIVCISYISN